MNGIGIDIEEMSKFNNYESLAGKILHNDELSYYNSIGNDKRKREFVAGRWAAKEAITKAIDVKPIFKEILIKLDGNILNTVYKEYDLLVSISHTDLVVTAICYWR